MKASYVYMSEIPRRGSRHYKELELVREMVSEGKECLKFEFENEEEELKLYNAIRSLRVNSKLPIDLCKRGKSLYVLNKEVANG